MVISLSDESIRESYEGYNPTHDCPYRVRGHGLVGLLRCRLADDVEIPDDWRLE